MATFGENMARDFHNRNMERLGDDVMSMWVGNSVTYFLGPGERFVTVRNEGDERLMDDQVRRLDRYSGPVVCF